MQFLKILACGHTHKNPNTYSRMACVDTLLQIKGILCQVPRELPQQSYGIESIYCYYRAESQARSCCGRLASYFSSHCPQFPHMNKLWISNTACLGQDWATPQSPEQAGNTSPISTSAAGNPLLFGLNCPDSLPWILFFLLLYPTTITIQFMNALQRSSSSLPGGHQRNHKTSHQNSKKSHGFIFHGSRNCHWGGSGSTHDSMLTNLVIDTPYHVPLAISSPQQCHMLLLL